MPMFLCSKVSPSRAKSLVWALALAGSLCTSATSVLASGPAAPTPVPAPTPKSAAVTPVPSASPAALKPNEDTVDKILATINDEVVLLSELQKSVFSASNHTTDLTSTGELVGGNVGVKEAEMLFNQLIEQKILNIKIREANATVQPEDVEMEIQQLIKEQNLTEEDLKKSLAEEGESLESYREIVKSQLETRQFMFKMIAPLVSITDEEVRNFFLSQNPSSQASDKVRLRTLVINQSTSDSADVQKFKKEKTDNVMKALSQGKPFADIVKEFSESPDVLKTGGELPPKSLAELPPAFQDALKTLKPNDVHGPITVGSSLFFLQLLPNNTDVNALFEKQRPQWEAKLKDIKFRERLTEYLRIERQKQKVNLMPFALTKK